MLDVVEGLAEGITHLPQVTVTSPSLFCTTTLFFLIDAPSDLSLLRRVELQKWAI